MNATTISPTPIYWDGESTLFTTDTQGRVRVFEETGNPVEIAERMWQERNEALQEGK